jgi:hypothetical protein
MGWRYLHLDNCSCFILPSDIHGVRLLSLGADYSFLLFHIYGLNMEQLSLAFIKK